MNRLCQAAGVPLVESGTAGYLGQVTPMIKVRPKLPFFLDGGSIIIRLITPT